MTTLAFPTFFRPTERSPKMVYHPAESRVDRKTDPENGVADRAFARRAEAGLDRLLRDIEKLEELERWDGMS